MGIKLDVENIDSGGCRFSIKIPMIYKNECEFSYRIGVAGSVDDIGFDFISKKMNDSLFDISAFEKNRYYDACIIVSDNIKDVMFLVSNVEKNADKIILIEHFSSIDELREIKNLDIFKVFTAGTLEENFDKFIYFFRNDFFRTRISSIQHLESMEIENL